MSDANLHMTGADLVELRVNYDWTQQQLAKAVGVSVRTVITWEQSKSLSPKAIARVNAAIDEDGRRRHGDEVSVLRGEVATLKKRIDYIEAIVLRERADELAQRRKDRAMSEGASNLGAVADSNVEADAEVEGRQEEP